MAVKRSQPEAGTYFCSFTCYQWLSLFEATNLYDHIYYWLNLVTNKNHIVSFVIMPNHMHLIIHVFEPGITINKILADGKRFLAYEIVKRLTNLDRHDLLRILRSRVSPAERQRGKKHRVFEVSSDIKLCEAEWFLLQKLEYVHANPVNGKWNLAPDFTQYPHSSAGFYELQTEHPKVKITHYLYL